MIFAALSEAADRGELVLIEGGMCRWHRRRDGVVVVREILVLPTHRKEGRGRQMLRIVQRQNPASAVVARCPVGSEANTFWQHMGFAPAAGEDGINTWIRRP